MFSFRAIRVFGELGLLGNKKLIYFIIPLNTLKPLTSLYIKNPGEINIFANKLAIISFKEQMGVIIESADVAKTQRAIFELAWLGAKNIKKWYYKRMDNIGNLLGRGGKYQRFAKPMTAARVCEAGRLAARGRFNVVSFADGLLTVGTKNSGEAANLQMESAQIIDKINKELGEELVKKMRFKMQWLNHKLQITNVK